MILNYYIRVILYISIFLLIYLCLMINKRKRYHKWVPKKLLYVIKWEIDRLLMSWFISANPYVLKIFYILNQFIKNQTLYFFNLKLNIKIICFKCFKYVLYLNQLNLIYFDGTVINIKIKYRSQYKKYLNTQYNINLKISPAKHAVYLLYEYIINTFMPDAWKKFSLCEFQIHIKYISYLCYNIIILWYKFLFYIFDIFFLKWIKITLHILINQINCYIYLCLCIVIMFMLIFLYLIIGLKFFELNQFFQYNFFYYVPILSLILISITFFFSLICYTIATKKNNKHHFRYFIIYLYFNIIMFFLVLAKSIIAFFIFYELFLFPSFYLVMLTSANKRSYKTSIYFLLWTQLGSFFFFLSIIYIVYTFNIQYFIHFEVFNFKNIHITHVMLFFGLGIKIPVWPFHFWLTKMHVEANTGFSIFLSGILVKIAIYGLYKFLPMYTLFNKFFFLFIPLISIIDMAIKIPFQTDLKKIVAMATIFEMNFMVIIFAFLSYTSIALVCIFMIFHSLISAVYFFFVDIIYKNYNSRIINSIYDIFKYNIPLGYINIVSLVFFLGLPLTIKFNLELFIFSKLFHYSFFICLLTLLSTFLFNFFFFKYTMTLLFGTNLKILKLKSVTFWEMNLFLLFYMSLLILNLI